MNPGNLDPNFLLLIHYIISLSSESSSQLSTSSSPSTTLFFSFLFSINVLKEWSTLIISLSSFHWAYKLKLQTLNSFHSFYSLIILLHFQNFPMITNNPILCKDFFIIWTALKISSRHEWCPRQPLYSCKLDNSTLTCNYGGEPIKISDSWLSDKPRKLAHLQLELHGSLEMGEEVGNIQPMRDLSLMIVYITS